MAGEFDEEPVAVDEQPAPPYDPASVYQFGQGAPSQAPVAIQQAPAMAAPVAPRMPLPSVAEQVNRWKTPEQAGGGGDDLQGYQSDMMEWAGKARSSKELNSKLAMARDATKAATEFVRRKDVENMVRNGMSIEDAEFKSRVKYNTASGSQLNALRPARTPTAMAIGGVPGVLTGRGDQWKPFPRQPVPKPTQEELDQKKWNSVMKAKDSKFFDQILDSQRKMQVAHAEGNEDDIKKWATMVQELTNQRANLRKQLQAGQSLKIGTVVNGHRFKGGNPANKESWERSE